jgi:16S rRNA U1498 N3-methylase RsmE
MQQSAQALALRKRKDNKLALEYLERIAKAIQESLVQCRRSSAPLATLEKFSEELRATSEGWTDKEIAAVEDGVRRGLNNKFNRSP